MRPISDFAVSGLLIYESHNNHPFLNETLIAVKEHV